MSLYKIRVAPTITMPLFELVIFFPLFLFAIIFHELAHGYVALLCGDPTAKNFGRLTLNPLSHIDPIGLLMFIISALSGVGFGWAKPVPINPAFFRKPKRDMMLVGIAGPSANITLIIFSILLLKIMIFLNLSSSHLIREVLVNASYNLSNGFLTSLIINFAIVNFVLTAFNLIPIPPLDGSRVLYGILPRQYRLSLIHLERYGFIIIFALLWVGVIGNILSFLLFLFQRIFISFFPVTVGHMFL